MEHRLKYLPQSVNEILTKETFSIQHWCLPKYMNIEKKVYSFLVTQTEQIKYHRQICVILFFCWTKLKWQETSLCISILFINIVHSSHFLLKKIEWHAAIVISVLFYFILILFYF